MPLMISRIGHARGRPVFFAAGRWGAITHHSLSVTSVWYRFVSRICCIRVVGVHMVSPGLVSATPWNHADASHSTSFETASKAKSIAYSNPASGGASGVYLAKLMERMGIAEEMKAKTKFPPPSGNAANLVVSGEAELAVQQEPEVMAVSGVDMVGALPGDLDNITPYTAGTGTGSQGKEAADGVIKFLHTPEAAAVFKARGL